MGRSARFSRCAPIALDLLPSWSLDPESPMRELPRAARVYLAICYLLGLAALADLARFARWSGYDERTWALTAALATGAAIAQVFIVARTGGHHSDHLTQAPVFAAILLLPAPLLALVVCVAFI